VARIAEYVLTFRAGGVKAGALVMRFFYQTVVSRVGMAGLQYCSGHLCITYSLSSIVGLANPPLFSSLSFRKEYLSGS
jgi:hypothetical protein